MLLRSVLLISSLITCTVFGQELWINPGGKDVKTVFYQGMNSSQTQGAKYTGSHGFMATTGEMLVNNRAIDVIQDIYVKPEIDEVKPLVCSRQYRLDHLDDRSLLLFMQQAIFSLPTMYSNYSYGTDIIQTDPTHQKESIKGHLIDISKINIGQEGDYANHRKRFDSCRVDHPQDSIICYGVSRGAATTFGALAKMNQEDADLSAIKLCVLEGCFDSVLHVLELRYGKIAPTFASMLAKVTAFKLDGPSPLAMVNYFPQSIPVVFITSKQDKEVPLVCTKNLVEALKNAGHQEIYLLELERSSHPNYMFDDETDRDTYQHFMHALYAYYNLPHNAEYAEQGYDLVAKSKVTRLKYQ